MKFIRKTKYYTGVVYEWNLPTGSTCPFAGECLVKVDRHTGKFDNKSNQYRCYAAAAERFPAVRNHRWNNFDFIKSGGVPRVPKKAEAVRIHMSGDFFNQGYFDLWIDVCKHWPKVEFWAYTKSLGYWVNRLKDIPKNLVLTASYGGKQDHLIKEYNLKHVKIIKNKSEAINGNIDYNDDEARKPNVNFYLLDNHIKK